MGQPSKQNNLKDKAEIEFYCQKILQRLKESPKLAQKAALIISEMLHQKKSL